MKRIVIALFLLFAAAARADLIEAPVELQARHPGGALFQLHGVTGPCVGEARLATYVSASGDYKVNGCFKFGPDGTTIGFAWFDGDASTAPRRAFQAPPQI